MKIIIRILITLIVMMVLSACSSGAKTISSEEENSANAQTDSSENGNNASTQNVQDIDLSMLGETETVESGGFSFRPIIGYDLIVSGGMVSMTAQGADSDVGPIFQLMGWKNETQKTNEQLYEQLKNETDMQVGAPGEIQFAGLQGISADITGENNGKSMQGRVVMVMVNDTQQFILMMGSPQTDFVKIAPYFDSLLASINFTEMESLPPSSGLESGKYVFTNGNEVKDVIVYQEVVYAATLGGLVTWRLDSGYSMHYTPLDGMGQANAFSITYCEIPEPRILVGTSSGISIYDPNTGVWDQTSLAPEVSGVESNRIDRLYCDQANNRLIIGYYGLGILDLSTGAFQQYNDKSGLLWNSVSDITVQGKDIWIANGYKGISLISGENITNYSLENNIPDERANALAFSKDGTLWVGASKGLMSFKGGKWTLYGSDSPAKLADINELEISAGGKIWVTTASMGGGSLCQFNIATADCDVKAEDVDYQGFVALALSETGNPIVGTNKAVSVFENGALKLFKTEDYLISNTVDSLASSPDGTLWIGTNAGIQVLDPANPNNLWTTYRQKDFSAMGGNWASGIAFAPDGTSWVSITNGSASRYQMDSWTMFEDVKSFDCVAADSQGQAWFGDDNKGIIVIGLDGSQVMHLTTAEGLPGDNVQAILSDPTGVLWIGTDQGLAKYENGKLEIVFGKDSTQLPNKYIRALALDENGALIIGTFTGVAKYDGTEVTTLIDFLKDGYVKARLTSLAVTPVGQILVGTDNGLLSSDDGTTWEMLTTKQGLPSNYISALAIDQFGATWVGSNGGLLQIVP